MILGVGINDANYKTREVEYSGWTNGRQNLKVLWVCPYFDKWQSMLTRCYSKKSMTKNPTYQKFSVCDEWLTFSNFKAWMENQHWEGKELDKDLLNDGSNQYSPNTCVFISQSLNKFMNRHLNNPSKYGTGVTITQSGNFKVRCHQLNGIQKYLGTFKTQKEAFDTWFKEKSRLVDLLILDQSDDRIIESLVKFKKTIEEINL